MMDDQNYCSCPFCDSVFILRKSLSKVICGNCGEMFDANLNRVIRVGNRFVPDVEIPTMNEGSRDSISPHSNSLNRYSPEQKPSGTDKPESEQRESLNLNIEPRPNPKTQQQKSTSLREPTITLPEDSKKERNRVFEQESSSNGEIELSTKQQTFTKKSEQQSTDQQPRSPKPFNLTGKPSKKRFKARPDTPTTNMHDLDRMHKQKSHVTDLIKDKGSPIPTIVWSLVSIVFLSILVMQIEAFAVPKYAQTTKYRPYLITFCKIIQCELPMFEDIDKLNLVHFNIEPHPSHPDAFRISLKLINEAEHPQPYPELQLTLRDKFGRIVGQRIYQASVYLPKNIENKIASGALFSVILDLAKPHDNAHGFRVDIVGEA